MIRRSVTAACIALAVALASSALAARSPDAADKRKPKHVVVPSLFAKEPTPALEAGVRGLGLRFGVWKLYSADTAFSEGRIAAQSPRARTVVPRGTRINIWTWKYDESAYPIGDCPVTLPNGNAPPGENASRSHHGNGALWTALAPSGKWVARPESVGRGGSVGTKYWWWRGVSGQLKITGRRLDAPARPLRAHIPSGYADDGFQASGIDFPSEGCWEITGSVVDPGTLAVRGSLTFVQRIYAPKARVLPSYASPASQGLLRGALPDRTAPTIPWTLRRPLNLPLLPPGAPCLVTPRRALNTDSLGPGLGSGPAYPVSFDETSTLQYGGRYAAPWSGQKVLWAVSPDYRGPILVRGHQLDGPWRIGFDNEGGAPYAELHIAGTGKWEDYPGTTRVRAPGCYAYQVDGTTFSRVIVFRAVPFE